MKARVSVVIVLVCLLSSVANGQEEIELGGEEGPDQAIIEQAVAAVIASQFDGFDPDPNEATTLSDPEVVLEELELVLRPLPLDRLANELEAWRLLLEERSRELSNARIELIRFNRTADAQEDSNDLQVTSEAGADPEKKELIERVNRLREARIHASDRLHAVLEAYQAKGGDEDVIDEYLHYDAALDEMEVDLSDRETAIETLRGWVFSDHGGKRVARKVGVFALALVLALLAGRLVAAAVYAALKGTGRVNELVRSFLRTWIRRIALLVGTLWGLSLVDVNVAPLLATLGAAGFILAFALQNSLSNFASGLLIIFQRPFDVGDSIEAAGITGKVKEVSLFTTHLSTEENKQVIVPNNMIWDDVVVNATGAETRRLSIEFQVDSEHSITEVKYALLDEMKANPDVLDMPAPEVKLAHVGSDGATFVCWPWVPTEKRDEVRWDLVARIGEKLNLRRGATKADVA